MIDPSQLEIQVAKIRSEVARRGGFTVDCGWLRLLCPDELAEKSTIRAHRGNRPARGMELCVPARRFRPLRRLSSGNDEFEK